jgi:Na+/H+ antiporter
VSGLAVILVLLLGVVASHWLAGTVHGRIALPIVQVGVGALIGTVTDFGVRLQPELFFSLFLPPLLFFDGWRISGEDLRKNASSILSLAFGLVVVTTVGVGLLAHALMPSMPLAVCFALAAALSPTDVVAANAMLSGVRAPARMLRTLEGEALFNDAAGLVCMRLAVVATLAGTFSSADAFGMLAWTAVAGVVIGIAVTWLIISAKTWLSSRFGEETSSQILISLLVPFAASLIAERLGASTVLAAVAAGMTMSRLELRGLVLPITRVRRNTVWDTVQFALNGIVFLILGEQTPEVLAQLAEGVREDGQHQLWGLGLAIAAITLALLLLRFGWIWLTALLRPNGDEAAPAGRLWPDWRRVAAMSTAGVRGAVTLAAALSLPLALPDGTAFPARDLVICVAAGVIVASLIVANLTLPRLLRGVALDPADADAGQERAARIGAVQAGLAAVVAARTRRPEPGDDLLAAVAVVEQDYLRRLARLQPEPTADAAAGIAAGRLLREERTLRRQAIEAERAAIIDMARRRRISGPLGRRLLGETDLVEASFDLAPDAAWPSGDASLAARRPAPSPPAAS